MSQKLKDLINKLEQDPSNLDFMNDIAIEYYQTPELVTDQEDLKFFRKAYLTQKTVKTTNNLAWQLFVEYEDSKQALTIIEECIALEPKSYLPYNLLGDILLDQERYEDALNIFWSLRENQTHIK